MSEAPQVVAYVEWIDSAIVASSWADRDDVLGQRLTEARDPIRSAGFLLHQDEAGITLCVSSNDTHDDVNLAMFIPRECIRAMSVWAPEVWDPETQANRPAADIPRRRCSS